MTLCFGNRLRAQRMYYRFALIWMETSFKRSFILHTARRSSSLSHKYSNMYSVTFFSLKLINFKKLLVFKKQIQISNYSRIPKTSLRDFCSLTEMRWFGEEGNVLWTTGCSFCHWSIILLFLPLPEPKPPPSLTEMFAYAASPASVCKTSSTCRLRHQKSMSMSASGHPKMMLPPIDSEGDNFKAM